MRNDNSVISHHGSGFSLVNPHRQEQMNANRMSNNEFVQYPFGLLNNDMMNNQLRRPPLVPQGYQNPQVANPAIVSFMGTPWGIQLSPRPSIPNQLFGANPFFQHVLNGNLHSQGRNSAFQLKRPESYPKMEERLH
eukprot:TRINITY_DN11562_c0_g1_i1.p1 TRINITY_DN11562_c0_g1~~TRINITY_DN11562_c0_g1_i1.p1  ORF type:complete len:136 (+),score=5.14 TRINITY_DN11562_c0_g1_i1:223-630(+)